MKRRSITYGILISLLIILYIGFPAFVDAWIRLTEWRKYEAGRIDFSEIPRPKAAPRHPKSDFIEGFDLLNFYYFSSFGDNVEINIYPPDHRSRREPLLFISIIRKTETGNQVIKSESKSLTVEVYRELKGYVIQKNVIENSVSWSDDEGVLDGNTWVLEGRKNNLVIRHIRREPQSYDLEFAAIGKRFLELAGIDLDDEQFRLD